ncbi:DUF4255 domain-containing protein [Lachnospiraceae bacterium ZAX-1]
MGYGVISDVSNAIVNLLREAIVPDLVMNKDAIGLCTPEDKNDIVVGVNLYDVRESEEVMSMGMKNDGMKSQTFPSTFLSLYYMITVYSGSDVKFRAEEEQRIFGKIIQMFKDYPILTGSFLGEDKSGSRYKVKIEMQQIDRYEKIRLWNSPNIPYKLSMFYKVYPVEITSMKKQEIARVVDLDFTVEEKEQE